MATLIPDDGDLVLALPAPERLNGLHGDIRVPLRAVEDVAVNERPFRDLRGIRAPGAGWPGRIALGTWRHHSGKGFAAVYLAASAVIVRLREGAFAWLRVSADDPEDVVARIRAAM